MTRARFALLNKSGVTLIEVMIAFMIFLFVSLATMQTALVSIDSNTVTALRDGGVNVAATELNNVVAKPFDDMVSPGPDTVLVSIRSLRDFPYSVERNVSPLGINSRRLGITVRWSWRGTNYVHNIETLQVRS